MLGRQKDPARPGNESAGAVRGRPRSREGECANRKAESGLRGRSGSLPGWLAGCCLGSTNPRAVELAVRTILYGAQYYYHRPAQRRCSE